MVIKKELKDFLNSSDKIRIFKGVNYGPNMDFYLMKKTFKNGCMIYSLDKDFDSKMTFEEKYLFSFDNSNNLIHLSSCIEKDYQIPEYIEIKEDEIEKLKENYKSVLNNVKRKIMDKLKTDYSKELDEKYDYEKLKPGLDIYYLEAKEIEDPLIHMDKTFSPMMYEYYLNDNIDEYTKIISPTNKDNFEKYYLLIKALDEYENGPDKDCVKNKIVKLLDNCKDKSFIKVIYLTDDCKTTKSIGFKKSSVNYKKRANEILKDNTICGTPVELIKEIRNNDNVIYENSKMPSEKEAAKIYLNLYNSFHDIPHTFLEKNLYDKELVREIMSKKDATLCSHTFIQCIDKEIISDPEFVMELIKLTKPEETYEMAFLTTLPYETISNKYFITNFINYANKLTNFNKDYALNLFLQQLNAKDRNYELLIKLLNKKIIPNFNYFNESIINDKGIRKELLNILPEHYNDDKLFRKIWDYKFVSCIYDKDYIAENFYLLNKKILYSKEDMKEILKEQFVKDNAMKHLTFDVFNKYIKDEEIKMLFAKNITSVDMAHAYLTRFNIDSMDSETMQLLAAESPIFFYEMQSDDQDVLLEAICNSIKSIKITNNNKDVFCLSTDFYDIFLSKYNEYYLSNGHARILISDRKHKMFIKNNIINFIKNEYDIKLSSTSGLYNSINSEFNKLKEINIEEER